MMWDMSTPKMTSELELYLMGQRAGDASSVALSASCAVTCSGLKTNGVPLRVRDVSGCAR